MSKRKARPALAIRVRYNTEKELGKNEAVVLALEEALWIAKRRRKLPAYLVTELLRFSQSVQRRIELIALVNAIQRAANNGRPLSRGSADSAFAHVAEKFGITAENAEKQYYSLIKDGQINPWPATAKTRKK